METLMIEISVIKHQSK